jgi:UDP-GlcNAc:undecaprenyl-phosphate GlcNAc-1-phosphate transferase
MRSFLAAFALSALLSAILTPLVRRLALRIGAVSLPGGRHIHDRAIPRLGGVAIVLAFCAPIVALFVVESSVALILRSDPVKAIGLFVGGAIMCLVGVVDDTKGLRASQKLLGQLAVATLAFACGFRIDGVTLPLIGSVSMGVFAWPITALWIVGIINAVNLIDGLDGLAGGVVFFAGLTNFVVAYLTGSIFVALVMAAMLGAVLGFLFYNFNPARIFMGDSGSYFLGFVLAASSLVGTAQKASTSVALLVPIVALGVPIFDTLFAMVRRFLERRPIFSPDRGHLHHRLLDMGITHRRAVLVIYGVSVAFAVSAIAISLGRNWQVGLALIASTTILLGLLRFAGYFEYLHQARRQKEGLRSREVELVRTVLPELTRVFDGARTQGQLLALVDDAAERAGLTSVELVDRSNASVVHAWVTASHGRVEGRELSTACLLGPEGRARAELRFRWQSDVDVMSPQMAVLLQVMTDVVTLHLTRLSSSWAPVDVSDAARAETPSTLPHASLT